MTGFHLYREQQRRISGLKKKSCFNLLATFGDVHYKSAGNLHLGEEKENYEGAIQALKTHLESENRVIVATDFRHTSQNDGESTSNEHSK